MHNPASPPRHVRFGAFELDLRSGELRKGPTRLKVPDQSIEILKALVEQPGQLVTREHLRDRLWPSNTFVDFEHGLNAAVRRLREALGDSADTPRFIETLPRRGYRFIGSIDPQARESVEVVQATQAIVSDRQSGALHWKRRAAVATTIGVVLVMGAIVLSIRPRDVSPRRWVESPPMPGRMTFEDGLQTDPTFSPDGRFIAYTSYKTGNSDIRMQPIAGGSAVPVTTHPARDSQPDWSPDGEQIVFRSERDGGGLFLVAPTGGHEQLLTNFGYLPRWSPDGSRVLFEENALVNAGRGRLYTVGLDGAEPRPVDTSGISDAQFSAAAVGWHPDGRRVTIFTSRPGVLSLITIDAANGATTRAAVDQGVLEAFRESQLATWSVEPLVWDSDGKAVYFVGQSEGFRNIWVIDVDPTTLRITGGPHRLTTMPEFTLRIALSANGRRIAFGAAPRNARLVSYPLDASGRHIAGPPQPLTAPELHSNSPDLSPDGTKIVFKATRPGSGLRQTEHWEQGIADGAHRILVVDARGETRSLPRWSPDGTRIAYRYIRPVQGLSGSEPSLVKSLVLFDVRTLKESQLTTPSAVTPKGDEIAYGWSPHGDYIVSSSGATISLVPVSAGPTAESKAQVVIKNAEYGFWNTGMSPNGRWICFNATKQATSRLGVVRVTGGMPQWLTDTTVWVDKPRWSADGRLIYFISRRGGPFNVWGVRFDDNGAIIGEPFQITNFTGPAEEIQPNVGWVELAVSRERLVVPVISPTGGIWMLENFKR